MFNTLWKQETWHGKAPNEEQYKEAIEFIKKQQEYRKLTQVEEQTEEDIEE